MKLPILLIKTTTGRYNYLLRTADVYIQFPKKAAEASEMYRVGPEKLSS